MTNTGRNVSAVLTGAIVWAVLWVSGALAASALWPDLLPARQPVTHAGALAGFILYSVALSILAGFLTAKVARASARRAVRILAGLQLALGIGFEVSSWSMTPAWYHIVFLLLIVPATLYGGRLGSARWGSTDRIVEAA